MISETASQIPAVRLYMGHTVVGIQSKITEIGGNTVISIFQCLLEYYTYKNAP